MYFSIFVLTENQINTAMKKTALFLLILAAAACTRQSIEPYGALPTPAQLEWQDLEMYMFCHFGPNTFTNVEWGNGQENPDVFNPEALDCDQWARIAKEAGMKGIVITAKHHDGFCLWPSEFSTHTVAQSAWRDGKGDVLKELSEACKKYGILFGVYISPWDRNHPAYGTEEYNQVFANTIREVHSKYGPIFEQWFDGANGGAKIPDYDWPLFNGTVAELSPNAVIFSDVGPGCRWVGNERGRTRETNWSRLDTEGFTPGVGSPKTDTLSIGNVHGANWIPVEVDVSIRPGWFYSPDTDSKVKNADQLMEIYFSSVGNNSNLILNVPPDRSGRINPADSASLMAFKAAREEYFKEKLGTGDKKLTAKLDPNKPAKCVILKENIANGQKVKSFVVEAKDGKDWNKIAEGTTIGHKKIVRFDPVSTKAVRVRITDSFAPEEITLMEVY